MTALAVPNAASAQEPVTLDGSPLNVTVNGIGGLQVNFDGNDFGEFCCSIDDTGNGFAVRSLIEGEYESSMPSDNETRTATQQLPTLTGPDANGTRTVTSAYGVTLLDSDDLPALQLDVVETASYTDGTHDVHLHFDVTNSGQAAATFSVGELADLYVSGSDGGVGAFQAGPPRFVGGTGDVGGVDGLLEVLPGSQWSHYEEGQYDSVFDDFRAGALTDKVSPDDFDNEAGVEWVVNGLAAGQSVTKDVVWRFNPPSGPPPPQVTAAPVSGSTVTLAGTAQPNDTITIFEGATPVGSTTVAPDGGWSVVLSGVSPGSHTYTAVAKDAAGEQSPASSPVTVNVASPLPAPTPVPTVVPTPAPTPLPPPVTGKRVNAQTKSGTIKIKLPGTNTFVELGPGQQIPTGTIVDTTKGRVTLTTAVGGGKTQHADFYQGIFRVTQTRGHKPVTQLGLAGRKPTCTSGGKAHASAARAKKKKKKVKTRSLWGSGHGAFRTKGQYSSATVRGTTWLTQDSCAGTLTRVTHGVVQVQDFVRHKRRLVRAGHRYLARAKRH